MKQKILILMFVLALALLFSGCASPSENEQDASSDSQNASARSLPQAKEFSIIAKQFEFVPSTITVKEGDTVKLTITSIDVTHGFFLPEYGINKRLDRGVPVTVEFVAVNKGSFEFFCNIPCGDGHKAMRGVIIVE